MPRVDDSSKKATKRAEDMKARGQDYFRQWENELATVNNPEIRALAESRRAQLQATFSRIKSFVEPARDQFNTWLADLKDLQKYLSNDLTIGGVDAAKGLIAKTKNAVCKQISTALAQNAKLSLHLKPRLSYMKTNLIVNRYVRASVGGALLTATMAGVTGCKKPAPALPPPPIVQVMEVTETNVPLSIEFIGQLDSPQNVEVRSRVEAFVEQVCFIEGTNVVKGALLFRLDKKPFDQRLAAARGMLAEAEAALGKYRADTNRLAPLADKKAIPRQDLENAVASVAVGEANVLSAKARVESATIDLGYCDVNAPLDGMIGAKQVSVGSFVGKGEPTLLATISQLDPIWFYCNIGEAQYLKAEAEARRSGRKVEELGLTLILADDSVHTAGGKIARGSFGFIDRAVDIKTGTLRVRAEFPNPEKNLRPGMFARIKVDRGLRPNSILVTERAVAELQGRNFVWIIGAGNKAAQRAVQVGETIGESVLILEGLKAGERIVTEGLQKVREDAPVEPKTAAEMAQAAAAQAAQQAEAKTAREGETKHGKE